MFDGGYNLCERGGLCDGLPIEESVKVKLRKPKSEETKRKMSERQIGEKNHRFGIKEDAEHIEKRIAPRKHRGQTGLGLCRRLCKGDVAHAPAG